MSDRSFLDRKTLCSIFPPGPASPISWRPGIDFPRVRPANSNDSFHFRRCGPSVPSHTVWGRLPHSKYAAPNPWMSRFAKPSVFRSDAEYTSPVHRPFADIGSESSRIRFECPLLIPTKEPKSADPLPEVRSSLDVFRTYRCSRSFRRGLSPSTTCSEPTGLDCLAQPLPGRPGKLPLPLADPLLLRTHSHFQAFESRRRHPAHRLSLRLP